MARNAAKRREIPPEETVEEIVSFAFDKTIADKAYKELQSAVANLAKHESSRTDKHRDFAKAGYAFCITLVPIGPELDKLKVQVGVERKLPGLPKPILDFLSSKKLELPYRGTSRNPYMGILSKVWEDAAKKHPELMSGDDEDDKGRPNYVMISRWAMVVCAAIDQNKPELLDANPVQVNKDYLEYRRTNPTLCLPSEKKTETETVEAKDNAEAKDDAEAKVDFERRKAENQSKSEFSVPSGTAPPVGPQEPHPGEGFTAPKVNLESAYSAPESAIQVPDIQVPDIQVPDIQVPDIQAPQAPQREMRKVHIRGHDFDEVATVDTATDAVYFVVSGVIWKMVNPPSIMLEEMTEIADISAKG